MIRLRPLFLYQNGKPQFAMIPYADFPSIQDELVNAACLRILSKAKAAESHSALVSLSDLKSRLGLTTKRRSRGVTVVVQPEINASARALLPLTLCSYPPFDFNVYDTQS